LAALTTVAAPATTAAAAAAAGPGSLRGGRPAVPLWCRMSFRTACRKRGATWERSVPSPAGRLGAVRASRARFDRSALFHILMRSAPILFVLVSERLTSKKNCLFLGPCRGAKRAVAAVRPRRPCCERCGRRRAQRRTRRGGWHGPRRRSGRRGRGARSAARTTTTRKRRSAVCAAS